MGYDISYDDLVGWEADLRLLTERVAGPLFTRPEPRATFADLVRGLLADVPRKNSWQLAEHVGHGSAYRLEWLLNGAKWDADILRDRVRDYVVATLGAEDGVLIADDTQVIKKGVKSVGVAPQHCGATGQTENCQVLPMLAYASTRGHAFIDRALYLPRRWTDDPQRCAAAGVPAERGFLTKPQLVIDMLDRALAAGVPFRYFTADSGYGRDPALRARCHAAALSYVLAVPVDLPLVTPGGGATRPDHVLATVPNAVWERRILRCGHQGRALLRLGRGRGHRQQPAPRRRVRPHPADSPFGGRPQRDRVLPRPRPRPDPDPRADRRRRDALEDRGEQRPRQGPTRPRPIPGPQMDTLAPARERLHAGPRLPRRHPRRPGKRPSTTGQGLLTPPPLIRPSLAEIRRLLARTLLAATRGIDHVLHWSLFRRLHQTRALISHYRRRGDPLPAELRM